MFSVAKFTMFSKIDDFTFINAFLDAAENGCESFSSNLSVGSFNSHANGLL